MCLYPSINFLFIFQCSNVHTQFVLGYTALWGEILAGNCKFSSWNWVSTEQAISKCCLCTFWVLIQHWTIRHFDAFWGNVVYLIIKWMRGMSVHQVIWSQDENNSFTSVECCISWKYIVCLYSLYIFHWLAYNIPHKI